MYKCFFGRIVGNKCWELEIESNKPDWKLEFKIDFQPSGRDHGGLELKIDLFKLIEIRFVIYDSRHWDYENDCWEIY